MATPDEHPLLQLRERLASLAPYPPGVLPVGPTPIPGTAFFPAGHGLWRPDPDAPLGPIPVRCVMVLGNNWGDVASYHQCLGLRAERLSDPTFRGLLRTLSAAGIEPSDCFFTNVYMGLLDHVSSLAPFPKEPLFRGRCLELLVRQVEVVRPRAILALGAEPIVALARALTECKPWTRAGGAPRTFAEIDGAGQSVVRSRVGESDIACVALTHPAMPNARLRRFRDLAGAPAEVEMVREACATRGYS